MARTDEARAVRVSVIIPVFEASRTLTGSLASIRASDYSDHEIIAADDGSTDGSSEILAREGVRTVRGPHRGPAAARNRAVEAARGEILFFTDADVEIFPDTLRRGVEHFDRDRGLAAVFGSYTPETREGGFHSRYKNYLHHYTHQLANAEAYTFWTGCGFVRRGIFERYGGFDEGQRFMSDVEFGTRLFKAGERIRVDKSLQVVHLKRYSLRDLVRSDLLGRAIPWTRIMLRHKAARADLNLRPHNVASVPLSYAALLSPLFSIVAGAWWLGVAALAFGGLASLNRGFLGFVRRRAGIGFAVRTLLVQWVIYLVSGVGVLLALAGYRSGGR
jgi:glycosyltransferase involved in cell wall biosynthesis